MASRVLIRVNPGGFLAGLAYAIDSRPHDAVCRPVPVWQARRMSVPSELLGLAVALGVGLLIGIERERNKGEGVARGAAGVRTFILLALVGAIAQMLGSVGIAVSGVFVVLAILASYRRSAEHDPGLTTEVAMLVVFLLGVLSMDRLPLAAALGVVVAIVLAGKSRLHRFTRQILTEQELHDALLLAAAAAIMLPLLPDRAIDPWQILNLRKLWTLAVIVMAITAFGHVALRAFGANLGLALAGLAGGFVSSAATIAGMGTRARANALLVPACVSAALLSNVSTVVLMTIIVGALSPPLLSVAALPLLAAGIIAVAAALLSSWRSFGKQIPAEEMSAGRAFEPLQVLAFVTTVAGILLISAAMHAWLGNAALAWTLGVSGLADVHAAAASAAQFVAVGRIAPGEALFALLLAFASNTATKLILAFLQGGRGYGLRLLPGLVSMVAAFGAVVLLTR